MVDRAIVFGIRGLATGVRSPNEFTADWVRRDPDKLIGFMAIDPMEDDHMEQIEQGLELGLRGIKIYPMLGRYDPSDPTNFAMFEKAQRLGLPVLSHTGTHPNPRAMLKYSHPLLVDEIAQAFPDLKYIMAHLSHPVAARLRHRAAQASQCVRGHLRGVGAAVAGVGGADRHAGVERHRQVAVRLRLSALDPARGAGEDPPLQRSARGHAPAAHSRTR